MAIKKNKLQKFKKKFLPKNFIFLLKNKLFLIFLITFFAYFQTLFMYFWNDDNAIIFKLQHLREGVGNLGSGIFGIDSPYRMVIFSLVPIYYMFGINSYAFFAFGILFYFFAAVSVYFFADSFLHKKSSALVASLIFASSLIGAESLWRVYNSIHTSITIIYIVLSCSFYNYYITQKRLKLKLSFYFISLIFFTLAVQWGFVRAHGLIIAIIAQEILFNFSFKYSLIRLTPFLYLSYIWYFAGSVNTKHLSLLFHRIFENYELELLLVPLKTLKNALIPDLINFSLVIFVTVLIFIFFKLRSRILLFSLIFIVSGYLTYYMIYHDQSLNSTHRYLTVSSPGISLFLAYIIFRIFKSSKSAYLASALLIILNIAMINIIHYEILLNRSLPTKDFYKSLTKEIPVLKRNSVIFFDVKKNNKSLKLFENFFGVGSMPNTTAIAIYYGLDRYDLFLPGTFAEMVDLINSNRINKDNVYTFYYNQVTGLKNTTQQTKRALWNEKYQSFDFSGINDINYNFSSPIKAHMLVKPILLKSQNEYKKDVSELQTYLDYLQSKKNYYDLVSIESDTSWQSNVISKIYDQDLNSSWMGSRGAWHDKRLERIVINLGEPRDIGAVMLKFKASDKALSRYIYQGSVDGVNYKNWKTSYNQSKQHAQVKIDKLEPETCRFIKIIIEETQKGDSPEIAEIEVIEQSFADLDYKKANEYEDDLPSLLASDQKDLILNYLDKYGLKIKVCFITDEFDNLNDEAVSKNCQEKIVKINQINDLELTIPQSGTILKQILIIPQTNVKFEIFGIKGSNILFDELTSSKL